MILRLLSERDLRIVPSIIEGMVQSSSPSNQRLFSQSGKSGPSAGSRIRMDDVLALCSLMTNNLPLCQGQANSNWYLILAPSIVPHT